MAHTAISSPSLPASSQHPDLTWQPAPGPSLLLSQTQRLMQDVQDVKFASWGGDEAPCDPAPACDGRPAFLTLNGNPFNPLGL